MGETHQSRGRVSVGDALSTVCSTNDRLPEISAMKRERRAVEFLSSAAHVFLQRIAAV